MEGLLRGSSPAPGAEAAPGDARFRLFDAVTAVLRAAAEQAPVLLVVDDLHAADVSSLRLVEFLTRELSDAPLALLVALRTDEVGPQHALVPTLAELARRRRTLRFHLTGLTREEVVRCLAAWAIDPPEPPLLEELIRRCEGNPFFVRELAHWLSDDRGSRASRASVPPSVRDVIRRRLGPRSETCAAILRLAAVIGRDFALDVLLASTPLPRDAALAALDEALSARILEEDPTGSGLRFAHALIQDCLLEEQSSLQRARAHRAIAAALSALDGDGEARLAERAHHACEGADADTAEEAVACALRAGARAMAVTAFEEAARLFGRALDALALSPARSPARRCAIAFDLARAQTHSGDVAGAERSSREAERLAKELGDTRRAARAAIGLLGSLPALAPPAAERIRALEDAAAALGPEDAALRISALSRLGLAWAAAGERARGIRHAETALREARTLGEPLLLAGALALRATVFDPREPPSTRLARVDEALRTLAGAPAPRIELECRIQRAAALLELGHTQAWDAERAAYGALATRLNQRTPRWFVAVQGALRRVMTGDLAAAEREIGEAWAAGRRAGHPDAETYFAIQLTQLRFFQGRLAEMEEPLRRAAASAPSLAGLRAALALVLSETGRLKETRRELDALARDDFSAIPRDAGWLSNLSLLALVAARLRDAEHAAALEERLAAYQDRNVCAFVVASNGSVQHFLGILAAARGGGERALPALERAVAHNAEMGIAPWTALSEQALAEASLLAGGP
ncbi:MAG TPA: AAA family ATPase, partial [Myxococcota bacterium]|nr:AAA family ATPase [Myxococcota bacterium]